MSRRLQVNNAVRLDLKEFGQEQGRSDTVGHGVVNLGQNGHTPVLESVDVPHFPKRTVAVELSAGKFTDHRCQFVAPSRGRESDVTHVGIEIELPIADPHWSVKPEWNGHNASLKRLNLIDVCQ